jgi:hypothetical protein
MPFQFGILSIISMLKPSKVCKRNSYVQCTTITYTQLLQKYNLLKLADRRKQLEAMMLYDISHNRYDCIPIIDRMCYSVPVRSDSRKICRLFATTRCRTNAGKRSPLFRLVDSYNKYFYTIDILAIGPYARKKRLLETLRSSL